MNRRDFLTNGSMAAAGSVLLSSHTVSADTGALEGKVEASGQKVSLALVGSKGIGWGDATAAWKHPDVEITHLCDVDDQVIADTLKKWPEGKAKPIVVKDYRRLLDDKSLDALIIATPDHWHALMAANAMAAGKHVYVEKPLANTLTECQYLVSAAKKFGKVVQVGQQQRSAPHWDQAVEYLKKGDLGKIRHVKCWSYAGWKGAIPVQPDSAPPEGVDYDQWLGPAPKRAFNPNRFHFNFRWFWDYGGGLMTDWGVHLIDYALIGMGNPNPISVVAQGGKLAFPDDAMQTPDTMMALYEFPGFMLSWEHSIGIQQGPYGRSHGVAFQGENGTLVLDRAGWEVLSETTTKPGIIGYRTTPVPMQKASGDGRPEHLGNFVEAIQKNNPALVRCPMEAGAHIAVISTLGNLAFRTGRRVVWDSVKKEILNDKEASGLGRHSYRPGYELPKIA